jgi:HK97 family phage major capsid protein
MPKGKLTEKDRVQLRNNAERMQQIRSRFQAIGDLLAAEKRSMNDKEKDEQVALTSELQMLQLRSEGIEAGTWEPTKDEVTKADAFSTILRSLASKNGVPAPYEYLRSADSPNGMIIDSERHVMHEMQKRAQDTTSVAPLVPLTIGDIIQPLEKGLILNKVGCKIQTGMEGEWQFPTIAGVEATINEENAQISDTVINIGKIKPDLKRCSLKIPVSNRAISQSNGLILDIVNTQIVQGLMRLLNHWMFAPTPITDKANGCFYKSAPAFVSTGSFSYKDCLRLKGCIMATGVQFDGTAAFVCSAATYTELEATPKSANSGIMVLENGMINGYPVFQTEYIGDGILGFGIFSYEMVGEFGPMSLIVDPYSQADSNITRFILNADFDMLSLRTEAFGYAKISADPAIGVNMTTAQMNAAAKATDTKVITISGVNLTADIALAITGTDATLFTVAPATIAKGDDGSAFMRVTVTYAPTVVGSHTAKLTLTSGKATEVDITLNGTCA